MNEDVCKVSKHTHLHLLFLRIALFGTMSQAQSNHIKPALKKTNHKQVPNESLSTRGNLLKCSAQRYTLSLSSSFRTGTTHTHVKVLVNQMDLHIQRSRGEKNNPLPLPSLAVI